MTCRDARATIDDHHQSAVFSITQKSVVLLHTQRYYLFVKERHDKSIMAWSADNK